MRTDYDKPVATQRRQAPPPTAPLPREGGVFRRFLGGFRGDSSGGFRNPYRKMITVP